MITTPIPTDHWIQQTPQTRRGHRPPWNSLPFSDHTLNKVTVPFSYPPFDGIQTILVLTTLDRKQWAFYTGNDDDTNQAWDFFAGNVKSGKANWTGGEFFNVAIRNQPKWWVIRWA